MHLKLNNSITKIYYSLKTKNCYLCRHRSYTAKAWESVIGLEVHAQISSSSKLFSRAGTSFSGSVNDQVGFFDAALPGTLPVINKKCVEAGILTALALKCRINLVSEFDRKHYFYSDLPAGFQITQQRKPIAVDGSISYIVRSTVKKNRFQQYTAKITQLQLEQDSGKSLHDQEDSVSLIDLNRAGIGLMEIVTEPDFRNGIEAAAFVKELQSILETIGTCDGKMEEGSLRVDASVSLRQPGDPLGTRSEVKNINSTNHIAKAIEFEIERQKKILDDGGEVVNETRSFDFESGETLPMRDKEKLHDYRFLPEPNLPPLRLFTNKSVPTDVDVSQIINIDNVKQQLPELPQEKRHRIIQQYHINMEQAFVIEREPGLLELFESVMDNTSSTNVKTIVNILMNDLLAVLNENDITCHECCIQPKHIVELVNLIEDRVISRSIVTKILGMLQDKEGFSVDEIVKKHNLQQLTDVKAIEAMCRSVIEDNPQAVTRYRNGKKRVFKFFMGEVMKKSEGRADPNAAIQTLQQLIASKD